MPDQAELRHSQLLDVLQAQYRHLGITGLRALGEGMDAKVYRARSSALGPVAVKLPHARWVSRPATPRGLAGHGPAAPRHPRARHQSCC